MLGGCPAQRAFCIRLAGRSRHVNTPRKTTASNRRPNRRLADCKADRANEHSPTLNLQPITDRINSSSEPLR